MTSAQPLDISVLICAYTTERWSELAAAIASMQIQTMQPYEVGVVIDHNEELFERVQRAFPWVHVVMNTERRGLSGARNSGVAVAQGDIVAFLDDDAVAAPDWLEYLHAAYDDARVIGVGGAIVPCWETQRPAWFPEEFDWVVGCTYRGMPTTASEVRNLIGANMSLRRTALLALGGFQHGLGRIGRRPLGCEETELCIRARQRWPQSTLRYEPRARVVHYVPHRRGHWTYFRARCYAEGLSKSVVTRLVGSEDGLSSERLYTVRTLPQGVVYNTVASLTRRDRAGLLRAGAIVVGFSMTAVGYIVGRLAQLRTPYHDDVPITASSPGG